MKNPLQINDPAVNTGRLSVQDFVAARENEIQRLERAISQASGKKRTFQVVPRVLRRRTASHNPKRVPKRLRDRAMREYLVDSPNPPKKRRVIEKQESVQVTDLTATNSLCSPPVGGKYKNRQKNHIWLPTHIWHRKRAKMTQKWGYVVPTAPTQKQYRMSHRLMNQSKNGTLLWDTSYYSTCIIREAGPNDLETRFPGCTTPLYKIKSWQGIAKVAKGSDLGPALVFRTGDAYVVNVHPAIYEHLFSDLCTIAKAQVQDLRYAIGSFDLIGTRAMSTLMNCLASSTGSASPLSKIAAIENLDMLPYHGMLAWNSQDPRLSFPPSKKHHQSSFENIKKAMESFNEPLVSGLFNDEHRGQCYNRMSTQKQLEQRKKPGEHVKQLNTDPEIPIVLLKLDDARIRVLLPWHWALPAWLSLVSVSNVYIAGTKQFEQLAFEQCLRQFPKDYPFTVAGSEAAEERYLSAKSARDKRPKSQRQPLDDTIGSSLKCCWEKLPQNETLLPVHVQVAQRGSPCDNARIYSVPETHLSQWLAVEHRTCRVGELPTGDLIGFVTSGAYNLETGFGTGVGYATTSSGYCILQNAGHPTLMLAKLSSNSTIYL